MRTLRRWAFAAAVLSSISGATWRSTTTRAESDPVEVPMDRPIAIIGATVIPLTDSPGTRASQATRLSNYTVIVRAGQIVAITPSDSLVVPPDALRIDGRGRFVTPGLVDAHVHLLGEDASADLPLYLANGVTTVRNMYGESYHLRWRREIAVGARLGPTLLTTSAFTDGLTSVAQARRFVHDARQSGYDAVKVHLPLNPVIYDALAVAARREGIPLVGHAPTGGVEAAVHARQRTIEHAESIMQEETQEQDPDTADIPRVIGILRGSGICVTPTLVTFEHIIRMTEQYPTLDDLLARPEMAYVRADLRTAWSPSENEYVTRWRGHEAELPAALAKFRRQYAWMRRLVTALAASGTPILAGTDASIGAVIPGFSLHEELRLLVDAGLSPYAALRAATTNPAACFGKAGQFGVVRPGARADLLLLDRDPLVDIAALAHPRGIVVRGRWLPADSLARVSKH
jgi:imidazolonepropionase-like amidohydrolase